MKFLVFVLASLQLSSAVPHEPSKPSELASAVPKTPSGLIIAAPLNGSAAVSCKILSTDPKWPTDAQWKAALPGVIKRGALKAGVTRPDWHLSARNAADVQKAVKFASENNVRLSVITTGHDFLARNDAPSGLGLSLEKLRGVSVLESFEPSAKGAKVVDYTADPVKGANKMKVAKGKPAAVSLGAGVTTQELNNGLDASSLFTMGAAHGEVGVAGGWGQAGGHGPLTSKYGLGVDQVLEYQVVTADGQLRIANAVSNPDLFWALRGGGGGTFGVVVQATIKAHPSPVITGTLWWINTTKADDTKSVFPPTAHLMTQLPELNKKGVQGYFYIYPNAIQGIFFRAGEDSGEAKARQLWAPILEKLSKFPVMGSPIQEHVELPSYKIFFDAAFGPLESHGAMPAAAPVVGANGSAPAAAPPAKMCDRKRDAAHCAYPFKQFKRGFLKRAGEHPYRVDQLMKRHGPGGDDDAVPMAGSMGPKSSGLIPLDSRLLAEEHLMSPNLTSILEASFPKMKQAMFRGHLTSGGKVWESDKNGSDTSVHPAWRKSLVHILGSGVPGREIPDLGPLKRLASNTGAYSNEASWQEENWKETFFGSHYPKLLSIKEKYDPNMLFYATPGVGADKMTVREGRLCGTTTPIVTTNNRAPASDNENIGKVATGNDFLTLWPTSQAHADAELNKAKQGIFAALLESFFGKPATAPAAPAAPPLAGANGLLPEAKATTKPTGP